jgi:hypothetical protein
MALIAYVPAIFFLFLLPLERGWKTSSHYLIDAYNAPQIEKALSHFSAAWLLINIVRL